MKYWVLVLTVVVLSTFSITGRAQTTPPKIGTRLTLASNKAPRGRAVSGSLILEIPSGYHVNAHDPVSRFALPTKIQVEAPGGIRVGPIKYPKGIVRRFSFSGDQLGVYENRAVIRFSIIVPPNQPRGSAELKALLNYQSCSNEVCFPPGKLEVMVSFTVT